MFMIITLLACNDIEPANYDNATIAVVEQEPQDGYVELQYSSIVTIACNDGDYWKPASSWVEEELGVLTSCSHWARITYIE